MLKKALMCGGILIFILLILQSRESARRNQLSMLLMRGAFNNPALLGRAYADYQALSGSDCQANWMAGKAAELSGNEGEKRATWINYLACSTTSIDVLRLTLPMDTAFAKKAVSLYPNNLDALYWLGSSLEYVDPKQAIISYNRIVQIDPRQGLAWCQLGNLYTNQAINLSLDAFLQCCSNEDPGGNGCVNAGRLMEKLGDPRKAIQYYRLSTWQVALDRADELAKQLKPSQ